MELSYQVNTLIFPNILNFAMPNLLNYLSIYLSIYLYIYLAFFISLNDNNKYHPAIQEAAINRRIYWEVRTS